ncbi:MAG: GNAT family protein [Angelakisella sp.]|nr:GNAT family protein [Angelakisella sp.]
MKIEFRSIDRTNYNECIDLHVNNDQKRFVASNQFSLVQAAYDPNLYPLAVYNEEQMIGFILYDFDAELNGWSMSRFMIDTTYQNCGFGKQALTLFLTYFKKNYPHVHKLYTSAEVDNAVAISLYKKVGFEEGEVFEYEAGGSRYTEVRMSLSL